MFIVLCAIKCVREIRYIKLIGQPYKRRAMNIYSITDIVTQSFLSIDFPAQYVAMMNTPGLEKVRALRLRILGLVDNC